MSLEHVTSLTQFQTILNSSGSRLVVVDFHATWCGPCHAIAPAFQALAAEYAGRARFVKVDVDDAQDVAQHCAVTGMPTFHMYRAARLVSSFSGADQRRLRADVECFAPSSAEVAFGSGGQALGGGDGGGPPKVDWNVRETAADAAARRMEAQKKAQREAQEAASKVAVNKSPGASSSSEMPPKAVQGTAEVAEETATTGATPAEGKAPKENDSRLKVNSALLKQLVDEMGFPNIRAEKALILTGNTSVERAVEWCFQHADDPDVDEPLQVVTKEGDSKPKLSPEEAKKKADELYARARARREAEEKKLAIQQEKDRVRTGKEITQAKQQYENEARKRAVEEKKREKLEAKKERERVRQMLEADKQRRHERFKMPGDSNAPKPSQPSASGAPKMAAAPSAAGGKIQFRLPDGSRLEGNFDPQQTMQDLVTFLSSAKPELHGQNLSFTQQHPRRKFSAGDYGATLGDLNLLPRGALTVSLT